MVLALNWQSAAVYYVHGTIDNGKLLTSRSNKIRFTCTPNGLRELRDQYASLLSAAAAADPNLIIAAKACASGRFASSMEQVKAEGIFQLVTSEQGRELMLVAGTALPKSLSCSKGQGWQERCKELFYEGSDLAPWKNAFDGAVAVLASQM